MNMSFWKGFSVGALLLLLASAPAAISQQPKPATPPKPAPAPPKPAAAPTATPAANLNSCKVGFVNLARVLEESKEGTRVKNALEAERTKALAPLKAKQDELEKLETQISALQQEIIQKGQVWDNYTLAGKRNELDNLRMKYSSILNSLQLEKSKIQETLMKKKNDMLKPLEDKLNAIMEDIGGKGGYCLVMDVSPPSANIPNFNPIIYRNPALEITDQIIAALDKGK